jgi:hypothetical protein
MRYKPKKENIEKLKTFLKKEENKKQKINYGKSI